MSPIITIILYNVAHKMMNFHSSSYDHLVTQYFLRLTTCSTSDLVLANCQAICSADVDQIRSPVKFHINFYKLSVRSLLI